MIQSHKESVQSHNYRQEFTKHTQNSIQIPHSELFEIPHALRVRGMNTTVMAKEFRESGSEDTQYSSLYSIATKNMQVVLLKNRVLRTIRPIPQQQTVFS